MSSKKSNWECVNKSFGAVVYDHLFENEAKLIAQQHGLVARCTEPTMTFLEAFVRSYTRKMHRHVECPVRVTPDGVDMEWVKVEGIGRYIQVTRSPTSLFIPFELIPMGYDEKLSYLRYLSLRIDCFIKGQPDPESPDEWYRRELNRTKDNAPA